VTKAERAARARKAEHRATVRARRQRQRLNQRERAAAAPVIVVRLPGPPRATAGQQSGAPMPPGRGYVSRWVRASAARRQRERDEAAARG